MLAGFSGNAVTTKPATQGLTQTANASCPRPEGGEDKVLSTEDGLVLSDSLLNDMPKDERRALSSAQRLCLALKRLLPLRVSQSDASSSSSK